MSSAFINWDMSFGFINTNQITLESFSSDLVPVDFVNKISKLSDDKNQDSFIHTDNNKIQYVDPVPYISSLRNVQDKLSTLMEECDKKKEIFEKSTKKRENDHYQNVITQSTTAVNLKSKFNDLLMTVEKLNTSKIDPLGEKLKKANNLKENSINIIFLIKCYNHFYVHNEPPIDLLNDKQRLNPVEMAKTLSQLLKLSKKLADDDQLPNAENAKSLILEFATTFENDQLKSFNTYYQSKNFARLQNITKTLFVYNDGINIVDFFVNSHPIFAQLQGNVKQKIDESYWKKLYDPINVDYSLDPASSELLEAVCDTILSEIDSITTIFQENSKQALTSLIFNLVNKIIKPRLNLLLATAMAQSKICYLRMLNLFSNGISQMTFAQLRSTLLDKNIDLNVEFDKVYNYLFNEYLNDNSYFKLEKENLEILIDSLIGPFEAANKDSIKEKKLTVKIEKAKEEEEVRSEKESEDTAFTQEHNNTYTEASHTKLLSPTDSKTATSSIRRHLDIYLPDTRILRDKMKNAKTYVPDSQKLKKFREMSSFIKINEKYSLFDRYKSSYNSSNTDADKIFEETVPESIVTVDKKSVLSLQVTQSIYKLILEALSRSIELIPSQINSYTIELFKLMIYKVGPSYIALGLESLFDNYIDSQSKHKGVFSRGGNTNLDLSFLSQFYTIFIQLYLLSTVVKKSFYPLVSTENDLNFISHTFNGFLQDVEIGVNIIIDDLIDIVKNRIDLILSKQPVNDYSIASESDRTVTSQIMAAFLEDVLMSALNELKFDPTLKIKFISKTSNYFLSALITHLSHLKVTMNGFTVLTHDLAQYILIFNNIKIDDTDLYDTYTNYENYEDNEDNEDGVSNKWEKEQLDQIQMTFKILNELPGLYTCQPESLKEFCSEGKLNDLKKTVIRDYISNREDFQSWFLNDI